MSEAQDRRQQFIDRFVAGSSDNHQQIRINADNSMYEQRMVRKVLQMFKLTAYTQDLMDVCSDLYGVRELRFAAFNQMFPTFPFLLGTNTLRGLPVPWTDTDTSVKVTKSSYTVATDPRSTEPARFKKFAWVPFVVAYGRLYEAVTVENDVRRTCMVFPRNGMGEFGMCIHDDDSEQFWTTGLSWVYKADIADRDRRLYVLPFRRLLEEIYQNGRGWKPD